MVVAFGLIASSILIGCSDSDAVLSTTGASTTAPATTEQADKTSGSGGAGQELVTESAPGRDGIPTSTPDIEMSSGDSGRGSANVTGGDTGGSPQPVPLVDEGQPDLGRPDEIVAEVRDKLQAAPLSDGDAFTAIEPIDDGPAANESLALRDGRRVNEAGELNSLDEPAALACADVERAVTAIDDGAVQTAAESVASAARRAAESAVEDIVAWSDTVETAWTEEGADIVVLLGFLSACTHGGYEL